MRPRDWRTCGAGRKLYNMAEPIRSVRLRIQGRVQGVWYRGWAVVQAQELGLSGWVRNRQDGSVEALVSGAETQLRAMIERCRRGPPAARVDAVLEEVADEPVRSGFRQLPTL
ncbi:MAG: acyP [Geminicoccaceae bacterium]|nr:acyP [Geminicoccaceae bacterium]